MSLAGKLLVASPLLADPNFRRTVVLMLTEDADGAMGVILNRPSTSAVSEHLVHWSDRAIDPAVVFIGGPVDPEIAIGLSPATQPDDPTALAGVGLVDLSQTPAGAERIRVFSGYSGWGAGQLQAELKEGAWLVLEAAPDDVFAKAPDLLWASVLRRQPGPTAMLAAYPPDPSLN